MRNNEPYKVAAGLREMTNKPIAFLYLDAGQEVIWDLPEVCGIPVYHGCGLQCELESAFMDFCPWVPLGGICGSICRADRMNFARGYEDESEKIKQEREQ